jgi:serine/threonine protein kinase
MALEAIKGGELSYNMYKFGRYDPWIAHTFFKQVVDAVTHMHARGFCHRDLKPWNIMLANNLSSIKVIDFSYSTPLDPIKFKACPDILKGYLPGTK